MKNSLGTLEGWEAEYKGLKKKRTIAAVIALFALTACGSLGAIIFLRDSGLGVFYLVILLIALFSSYLYSAYEFPFHNIKAWRIKLQKHDSAITEFTTGVEFQLREMGLEPVTKIELRRKQ